MRYIQYHMNGTRVERMGDHSLDTK